MTNVINTLLTHDEPAVRYLAYTAVQGHCPDSPYARRLQRAIAQSPRVQALLSPRNPDGRFPFHPYQKYAGCHWVLVNLADLAYPPGDKSLLPLRDQVYDCWLSPQHTQEVTADHPAATRCTRDVVPIIHGRARRCASQEGNALYATLALGIADHRADQLAANLIRWQWPDGGWNCDRSPSAHVSSFHESLAPLRGLAWHARLTGNHASARAAEKAAELFLRRHMYRRLHDDSVINQEFLRLRYPRFWVYDILFALRVLAEAGFITDHRCADALDLLQSKALPDGSYRCQGSYAHLAKTIENGATLADWGPVSRKLPNPFVTIDALYVLRLAGQNAIHR
ncbi:MAG: hypothetical protein IT442_17365 [Phycisphaeraceae bacterium]|nr:hypothetical protein [Phycisphaeraceae bacterium]